MIITQDKIRARAKRLGFSFIGFTNTKPTPHVSNYLTRLQEYEQSDLSFLSRSYVIEGRKDPTRLMENARSIIVLGICYPPSLKTVDENSITYGNISAYAVIPDYHTAIKEKARLLIHELQNEFAEPFKSRIFVDSGPMMEKDMAFSAGLGWIGKNSLCIHPKFGSYFFICCIVTDLNIKTHNSYVNDLCGDCKKCEEACPASCIHDHTIDPTHCISYLTIEHKGIIPRDLRTLIGNRLYGCDVCQSVCPYNQKAINPDSGYFFQITPKIPSSLKIIDELQRTPDTFKRKFSGTPVLRIGYERYMRNTAIVAGNSQNKNCIPILKQLVSSNSELIGVHAVWALSNYLSEEIRSFMLSKLETKISKKVTQEIHELFA